MGLPITSKPGWSTISIVFCLFLTYGVLISEVSSSDCDDDEVEERVEICMDAFNDSIHEHLKSIKATPKRKGCCLSSSLEKCLEYAYKMADCDIEDDEIEVTIKNATVTGQLYINKLAGYVGTILCGEMKRDHCGEGMLHRFDEAIKEIGELNGTESMTLSAFALLVALVAYTLGDNRDI